MTRLIISCHKCGQIFFLFLLSTPHNIEDDNVCENFKEKNINNMIDLIGL